MSDILYDVIIIGATAESIALARILNKTRQDLKVAFVYNTDDRSCLTSYKDLGNIVFYESNVKFVKYRRNLFTVGLLDDTGIFSRNLICGLFDIANQYIQAPLINIDVNNNVVIDDDYKSGVVYLIDKDYIPVPKRSLNQIAKSIK